MYTLEQLQELIKSTFEKESFIKNPENLYLPVEYTLKQKGKRIRPMLMLISCQMFAGKVEDCLHAAIGLEIFHNFTLLHDDIMDQSPLRRGNPTVYKKWDTNTAILSGDVMFGIAYDYFLRQQHALSFPILKLFTQTTMEICEGQQWDMELEKINIPEKSQYIEMIRLKTAVLLAASLKIGAMYAGASEKDQNLIYDLGIKVGIAFQLQDDWLDCFGDQQKFGKPIGIDIVDNKKTYLYLDALVNANSQQKEILTKMFSTKDIPNETKVNTVRKIYDDLHIKEKVSEKILGYYNEGIQLLSEVNIKESDKEILRNFTEKLLARNY